MNSEIKAYIESGILELYVAGVLSESENQEVHQMMLKHPEIKAEVIAIESAIVKITSSTAPKTKHTFSDVKNEIDVNVIPIKPKYNWLTYTGWAASLILGVGLIYNSYQNNVALENLETISKAKEQFLEDQITTVRNNLDEANALLQIFRDKNVIAIPLEGQTVAPEAYAKVFWNKDSNKVYLDVQGLPNPPEGKVYQVWSLQLSPELIPTSLGVLDQFNDDDNKVFTLENTNNSQGFGITLEPEGGSKTPTLEQLYTLGAVKS